MSTRNIRILIFSCFGALLIALSAWLAYRALHRITHFNGQSAYQDVLAQVSFGPRTPGSIAHAETVSYIQQELEKAGWIVRIQSTEWQGFSIQNVIASRSQVSPHIVIGAHYDSRLLADQDPGLGRNKPVPGANDGASGVAVLLELARTLSSESLPIWLVFFDAEDNGGLENRQWIMGSRVFVASLIEKPQEVVILDMVGDADLNIFLERNSDSVLAAQIWTQAASLGYGKYFIPTLKYDMIDDHTPFLEAGIPAVDIIDFDYPYWHTSSDTVDKISAHSLQVVGDTLWLWIESQK